MTTTLTQYGPIVNDISGMGETNDLLGGAGRCRWKQLINGMHLNGPWNCIEYVVIPSGCSCGTHTHRLTEEIYYILSGAAEMNLNGEAVALRAGDLVTAPIGTSHGTVNTAAADMEFLVVEVFPGRGPDCAPVHIELGTPVLAPASCGSDASTVRRVELGALFTGPWRTFEMLDVAPGARIERDAVADADEVLFVAGGRGRIEFGGSSVDGARGLCVGVPPESLRTIINDSPDEHMTVLSTIVGLA